ncbi:MAG: polysaccharide biosynthesis/export family protein [Paludibacter sp.]|nr:polysaccharide biosynthesis/export family protein [Paludibacter sp.]
MKKLIIPVVLVILLASCKTSQEIVYLQGAGKPVLLSGSETYGIPDPIIKTGDILTITVNSTTPEAAVPFNLPIIPMSRGENSYNIGSGSAIAGGGLQNYLVDTEGKIVFPVIGKLFISGMTKSQVAELIKKRISPRYIKEEPVILIRFAGFKVSVLGEVARPNVYEIDNEKVSILEILAKAGDMTIYGQRDNILLIRETGDKRESVRIDLRDKNLINSPYYYLQQNDVIYVQPNNPRTRASAIGTAETISISVVGTLISLTSLVINLIKK